MTPAEIGQALWEAVAQRDVERILGFYEPEAELYPAVASGLAGGRPHRGLDEIRTAFVEVFETWELFEAEVLQQGLDLPPHALALARVRVRGRGSGTEFERPYFQVVTFSDDERIRRMKNTFHAVEALEDLAAQLQR